MPGFAKSVLASGLTAVLLALTPVATALATGEIGEHVKNLKAHIGEYEQEVPELLQRVDGMVNTYAQEGSGAVDTGKLIDWWEAVKYHAAIETQYPPLYASIWQGIYGVKQGIEQSRPVSEVRAQREALARALWQGLGAVKLAASQQASGEAPAEQGHAGTAGSSEQTMNQIAQNLSRVVERYRNGSAEAAKELVHSTYAQLFEGVEGPLIEQDAGLVEALEKDFNVTLPQLIESGAPAGQVAEAVSSMRPKLARARELLAEAEQQKKDVF